MWGNRQVSSHQMLVKHGTLAKLCIFAGSLHTSASSDRGLGPAENTSGQESGDDFSLSCFSEMMGKMVSVDRSPV